MGSAATITDEQLTTAFNHWLDHYTENGDKHHADTPDWKITEYYYDMIVERVFEELPELSDDENEVISQRISELF